MGHNVETRKRAYDKMKARRKIWFDQNGPCSCGSTENLELHHKDPSKKITHQIWTWAEDRFIQEADKCIVLCKNCHIDLHRQQNRKHGLSAYNKRKCRCDICKAARARAKVRWAAKKGYKWALKIIA